MAIQYLHTPFNNN